VYNIPKMYRHHTGHVFTMYEKNMVYKPRTISTITEEKLKKYDILGSGEEDSIVNSYNKFILFGQKLLDESDISNIAEQKDIIKNLRKNLEKNIIEKKLKTVEKLVEYQTKMKESNSNNPVTEKPSYDYIQKLKLNNTSERDKALNSLKYVDEISEGNVYSINQKSDLMDNQLPVETKSVTSSIKAFSNVKTNTFEDDTTDNDSNTTSISVATILQETLNKSIDVSFYSSISPIQRDSFNICYTLLKILGSGGTSLSKTLDIGSGFNSNMLLNERRGIIKEILDNSISPSTSSLWKTFPAEAFETSYIDSLISDQ
jgi:hypothetical protein